MFAMRGEIFSAAIFNPSARRGYLHYHLLTRRIISLFFKIAHFK